jgi:hypothetical protein
LRRQLSQVLPASSVRHERVDFVHGWRELPQVVEELATAIRVHFGGFRQRHDARHLQVGSQPRKREDAGDDAGHEYRRHPSGDPGNGRPRRHQLGRGDHTGGEGCGERIATRQRGRSSGDFSRQRRMTAYAPENCAGTSPMRFHCPDVRVEPAIWGDVKRLYRD